ncbi:MAG: hypothetical protein AB7F09_20580 [Parvibaculaceae bacterium]
MLKMVAAGGMAVLVALALQPADARADTRIGIGVGGGWYPDPYEPRYPVYDPDDDEYEYISCREGRRIVRDYGFYRVTPTRCGGSVYRYEAVKRDRLWSVRVSARSGRIISARVIGDDY